MRTFHKPEEIGTYLGSHRTAFNIYDLYLVRTLSPALVARFGSGPGDVVACIIRDAGQHPATLEAHRRAVAHGLIHHDLADRTDMTLRWWQRWWRSMTTAAEL